MYLPDGSIVQRHPDFVCIGTANTFGMGATHEYNSSQKLSKSTLSRFQQKLAWGYNAEFEIKLASDDPDRIAWVREIQAVRIAADVAGLDVNADPRTMIEGFKLLGALDIDEIREGSYLAGLDSDQKYALRSSVKSALGV